MFSQSIYIVVKWKTTNYFEKVDISLLLPYPKGIGVSATIENMKKQIKFYRTNEVPYGLFSNFDTKHPIMVDGVKWPTTEHYFQAQKFAGTGHVEAVRQAAKPRDAAYMGRDRSRPLRADWEQVKDDVMRTAVRAKFTQHGDILALLLNTGDAELNRTYDQ